MCIENCFHSHININIYRTLYQQKKMSVLLVTSLDYQFV